MRWTSVAVLGGFAATCSATIDASGAVIDLVAPPTQNPEGCRTSLDGKFLIEVEPLNKDEEAPMETASGPASDSSADIMSNAKLGAESPTDEEAGEKAGALEDPEEEIEQEAAEEPADGQESLAKRDDAKSTALVMELKNSVLVDAKNRTGYIASNYQFQFDGPPQAGSIYTGGFCVSGNGSLALGGSFVMYRCKSGDFYNIYDRHWAAQCDPIRVRVAPLGADGSLAPAAGGPVPVGTSMMTTTTVKVLPDGQPQVVQTEVPVPVCQIGDGQIQAHVTPCAEMPPVRTAEPAMNPVRQIADGQPQAPAPQSLAPQSLAPQSLAPQSLAPQSLAPPTSAPSSAPFATSTRATEPQAPMASPTNTTVVAGADMAMRGPAASLITAIAGLFFLLF